MAKRKRKTPPAEIVEDAKPRRARRLRIVADAGKNDGVYGPLRDVYLESRLPGESRWTVELFNLRLAVELAADMVRYAAMTELPVRYEPAGNMAAYFLRFRQDQPELFE